MSGQQFDDVEPVTRQEWLSIRDELCDLLHGSMVPVGSTDIVPAPGDIDLVTHHFHGRDGLARDLEGRFQLKKKGTDLVSLKYPCFNKWVQVDVMVADTFAGVNFLCWSRSGESSTQIKGAARAVLWNIIIKYQSQSFFKTHASSLDRERYVLDFGSGLYYVKQTRRGKKRHKVLKDWKTLERTFITNDPQKINDLILGEGILPVETQNFLGLLRNVKKMPYIVSSVLLSELRVELEQLNASHPGMCGNINVLLQVIRETSVEKLS